MFFLPKNYYANFWKGIIEVTGVKVQFKFPQRELIIFFDLSMERDSVNDKGLEQQAAVSPSNTSE